MIDTQKQAELRRRFNPDGSELRQAQLRMLGMLKSFDLICHQHNITYWLDSGTLLGAARHGGFIPWDEDTDVCMPRKDAIKLKKIMGDKVFYNSIVLQNSQTDPHYRNISWMTLRDINSEYIQESDLHNSLKWRGLQVDIFIVDEGVSLFFKKLCAFYQHQLIWRPWLNRKYRIMRPLVTPFFFLMNNIISPALRLVKFNDKLNKGYGSSFGNPMTMSTVFPLEKINFEEYYFPCPHNVDDYLTQLYGDWHQIPTSDRIRTHNVKYRLF